MEEWTEAVVRIWWQRPQQTVIFLGTAFLITPEYLLTAKHVLEPEINRVIVKIPVHELKLQGQAWSGKQGVEAIECHLERDVATLKLKKATEGVVCIPLADSEDANLPVGIQVTLAGYCQSSPDADVDTPPVKISSYDGVYDLEVAHSSIAKGMSGGPAVKDGKVVGLISGRHHDENKTYLLRLNAFRDFLAEHIELQTASQKGAGKLYGVPQLPPHFLERPETLAGLKAKLLYSDKQAIAVTSAQKIGVHGMGGIGKSVLAAALARGEVVQQAFPDGIFWLVLGQTPDLVARQQQVAKTLSGKTEAFVDTQEGKARLQELLEQRKCLLILDDAWEMGHISALNVVNEGSQLLVTTRNANLITGLGGETYDLNLLSPEQARELLSTWSNQPDLPLQADDIIKECGYLPLAVAMVGAMLRDATSNEDWEDVLTLLREAQLEEIEQEFPDYVKHPTLFSALHVSVNALAPGIRERYLDFAVFPEDTPVPVKVLETFWTHQGLKRFQVKKMLRTLRDRSLLRWDENGMLTLHDLQRDYLRSQAGEKLPALHQRLLDAYKAIVPEKDKIYWEKGPNDGYFFKHICYHLYRAENTEELHALLFHFPWLQTKLGICGVNALLSDYDLLPQEGELKLIRHTLQLSAHVLDRDSTQLPSQLHGRLCSQISHKLTMFLQRTHGTSLWLRPIICSLTPPGGALVRILAGHMDSVMAVAVTPDGRQVISASLDKTLKVWDLTSGEELRTLTGHTDGVAAIVVTPDGRQVISASYDKTLKVWDLANGKELRTLTGHTDWVMAVTVTPDGQLVISGSHDETLKVWELSSGKELQTLTGHIGMVSAVVVTPDGQQVVSASWDGSLRVWNLTNGKELRALLGHTKEINAVAITPDGQRVISGSRDETLKIWNLANGKELRTLTGHKGEINAVAVSPDGRWMVSVAMTMKVWELSSGEALHILTEEYTGGIYAATVTPDGRLVVSASWDGSLKMWDIPATFVADLAGSTLPPHTEHMGRVNAVNAVSVTPDGQQVVSASWNGSLKVWMLTSGKELRTFIGHTDGVNAVAVTPNGRLVVSASSDKTLKLWDLVSGVGLRTLIGHTAKITAVAVSPDGRQVMSASKLSRGVSLKVWDLNSGEEQLTSFIDYTPEITAIVVTPDGGQVVLATGPILRILDINKQRRPLVGHTDTINALTVTLDGLQVVSASSDRTLKVWDLSSGKARLTLTSHMDSVMAVAVTPNGRLVVSASSDKTLKLWDLSTGNLLTTFYAEAPLLCCAIASDGKTIVTGDELGNVHFLRAENGELQKG